MSPGVRVGPGSEMRSPTAHPSALLDKIEGALEGVGCAASQVCDQIADFPWRQIEGFSPIPEPTPALLVFFEEFVFMVSHGHASTRCH